MTNPNRFTQGEGIFGRVIEDGILGHTVTVKTTVDASAGGVAQTTDLTNLLAGTVLRDVVAVVNTPFDGDLTTTFEVGVSGNIDKYIDTVDFEPEGSANTSNAMIGGVTNDRKQAEFIGTDTQLVATWTNTANATAGSIDVYVIYVDLR